jgi:hypothetical protein
MIKKEYFFVFALIGLSIIYFFLSLIVFLSRGKWSGAFNKKLAIGAMIVTFCAIINSQNIAYSQTAGLTPLYGTLAPTALVPTETPPPIPPYSAPMILITPSSLSVHTNEDFTTDVNADSGTQKVAAYGMSATYDSSLISVDIDKGNDGVVTGADGFVSAVNSTNPGEIIISGFDVNGVGPGSNLNLFTICWTAGNIAGSSVIDLTIDQLVDTNAEPIGYLYGSSTQVQITELVLGDVNSDDAVDIIDALLVAQYFVDLNPPDFNPEAADVDASGTIDIVDALLIARKFVGLIDTFPGE